MPVRSPHWEGLDSPLYYHSPARLQLCTAIRDGLLLSAIRMSVGDALPSVRPPWRACAGLLGKWPIKFAVDELVSPYACVDRYTAALHVAKVLLEEMLLLDGELLNAEWVRHLIASQI
jgi:hypothetical protein